jgi:hypothetical protein
MFILSLLLHGDRFRIRPQDHRVRDRDYLICRDEVYD